jgi:hypothetical protein
MRRANLLVDHDHVDPYAAATFLIGAATITETCGAPGATGATGATGAR